MRHPLPAIVRPPTNAKRPLASAALAVVRLVCVSAVVLYGTITMLCWFGWCTPKVQQLLVQRWAQRVLRALGLRIHTQGRRPLRGPLLMVANHVSWLDIVALHATGYCRFVAKDDVQRWPVVGWLARRAGTLFLARSTRRDAMRIVQVMHDCLTQQQIVAIFPEGTTGDGRTVLPFHANLLQAAIDTDAPMQPIGLRYGQPGQPDSPAASFVGNDTLVSSLWRVASAQGLSVTVIHGRPERALGRSRHEMAAALRQRIQSLRQSDT